MCGFFGLQSFKLDTNEKITISRKALNLLHSRGPDTNDVVFEDSNNLIFTHNRLSILDLSPNGNQPMKSLSGNFLITFNGEIYNHKVLRKELLSINKFNQWKGTSDTETLLQAIEIWGLEKTLKKIVGMYSFALWDKGSEALYLVRDRFGEKPLYYGWLPRNESFVFSSDLIFDKLFKKEQFSINGDAVNDLLHLNYINNDYSIYKNILKIQPGSYLKIHFKKKQKPITNSKRYWEPEKININKSNLSYRQNIDHLDHKLTRIVKDQIFADVEVGTFLSGGIDSSLITAKAQELSSKKIKTFCIGNEDKFHDESKYASRVAKFLSTDHDELILNKKDIIEDIPSIINNLNEPLGDSSFIPTFYVSKLAKKKVKVVLTGDAGDEIFGGYNRYTKLKLLNRIYKLPKILKKIIFASLSNLGNNNINRINQIIKLIPSLKNEFYLNQKIKKILDRIDPKLSFSDFIFSFLLNNNELTLLNNSNEFSRGKILNIFNDQFSNKYENELSLEEKIMFIDTINYLPNDILFKVDRASMSNSLETRAPFLDNDLYEFALNLPIDQKVKNSKGKLILRDLLKKKIPKDLIDRPKAGFSIPIGDWIREPLRDWSENLLSKKNIDRTEVLNFSSINKIWLDHKKGIDNSSLLWSILVFQNWRLNR